MKDTYHNSSRVSCSPYLIRGGQPASFAALVSAGRRGLLRSACVCVLASASVHAAPLFTPGDPVFAYDLDTAGGATGGCIGRGSNWRGGWRVPVQHWC